jgi:hypothetical protein
VAVIIDVNKDVVINNTAVADDTAPSALSHCKKISIASLNVNQCA